MAQPRDVDVYAPGPMSPLTADAEKWLTGSDKPAPHASGTIAGRHYDLYDLAKLKADHPARNIVSYGVQPFHQLVVVWGPKPG